MESIYEYHGFINNETPFRFHEITNKTNYFNHIHWHENMEILFFEKDLGEVLIDDKILKVKPGDIAIVNSEQLHSIKTVNDEVIYSCLIIDKALCENYGFMIDEQHINNIVNDERLYQLLSELKKEFHEKDKYFTSAISSTIINMLIILYRNYTSEKKRYNKKSNTEMIKSAIKFIKKNFDKQISIDDIATYTGYSKYHFCRCFKEITEYTVNAYITNVRLDYAIKLLTQENITVTDAAEKCGFSDISYFTKVFKKRFFVTPSKLRSNSDIYKKFQE